jgi:hypothetical protein
MAAEIYQRERWFNPKTQEKFHRMGRGIFADIEIEHEGKKYFTPQIISEVLAYIAMHNQYNWNSARANEPVTNFVAMAAAMLETISTTNARIAKKTTAYSS